MQLSFYSTGKLTIFERLKRDSKFDSRDNFKTWGNPRHNVLKREDNNREYSGIEFEIDSNILDPDDNYWEKVSASETSKTHLDQNQLGSKSNPFTLTDAIPSRRPKTLDKPKHSTSGDIFSELDIEGLNNLVELLEKSFDFERTNETDIDDKSDRLRLAFTSDQNMTDFDTHDLKLPELLEETFGIERIANATVSDMQNQDEHKVNITELGENVNDSAEQLDNILHLKNSSVVTISNETNNLANLLSQHITEIGTNKFNGSVEKSENIMSDLKNSSFVTKLNETNFVTLPSRRGNHAEALYQDDQDLGPIPKHLVIPRQVGTVVTGIFSTILFTIVRYFIRTILSYMFSFGLNILGSSSSGAASPAG